MKKSNHPKTEGLKEAIKKLHNCQTSYVEDIAVIEKLAKIQYGNRHRIFMIMTKDSYVLRGGSWLYNHGLARCASRFYFDPEYRFSSIGFRCVRTLK
jgi:formylglycine-generating enzyme required for sulfatase activity